MGPGMVAPRGVFALRVQSMMALCCWMMVLLLLSGVASAQTRVGGAIAADARWTAAASPYLLQSDLIIQNGATLEIEAGTEIHVAAGVAAHVQSGTLKAIGRVDAPIRVLSARTREGVPAAAGDYKAWNFNSGARNSVLQHVVFQHGSGLAVRGTSVTINDVQVLDSAGAAITVDLSASLTGHRNLARGNDLDAVLVPAGDVTTTVTWGLRGIPYVVESGTLSVGQSPTLDAMTPATLQAGETATVQVTGKRLGGLVSAQAQRAGVNIEILPGATATSASLQVSAAVEAEPGPAVLSLLTDAGIAAGPATLQILAPQPTITALEPARVFVGQGVVSLDVVGRGFGAETVVQLNGTALATTRVDATRLRVSVPNQSALANLAVRLRSPDPSNAGQFVLSNEVALPVQAAQIRVTPGPAEVIRGARTEFTVALPYAPPGGDAAVTLVSSVPGVASVPASVVVPTGETSATFELTAVATGNTVITASRSGMVSGQSTVTVVPPPSLRLSPQELLLGAGRSAELELVASKAAPAGGLAVQLRSSAAGVASVTESVLLTEGTTTLKIPVSSHALGSAVITASADSHVDGQATISVRPVSLNLPSATVVAPGLTRAIPLTLSDPAPAGGLTVQLRSSNASIATVPASVHVEAGATAASFTLSGVAAGAVRIDATAEGYEAAQLNASIESIQISLGASPVSAISLANKDYITYPVRLSRPAPAGGVVIDLSVEDASIADVQPRQVTIAEGEIQANVTVTITADKVGSTRVLAGSAGLAPAQVALTVQAQAQLGFSRTSMVLGKGTRNGSSDVYVQRRIGTTSYTAKQDVQVRLRSSDPERVKVPDVVKIPGGSWYAYFQLEGVEQTDGTPVTIEAYDDVSLPALGTLAVNVVAPEFRVSSLDVKRTPASARDDIRVQLYVPGAATPSSQVAARALQVDLAIVDASPADIVSGFHASQTAGESLASVTIPRDEGQSALVYIASPRTNGSYAIRASSVGLAATTSAKVTVSAPELRFSRSTLVAGKGLTNYTSEISVQRVVDGALFSGAEPLLVRFSSSDGKVMAQDVTIPANQSTAYLRISGVEFTEGVPSILDAVADGYASPDTKLALTVVAPELRANQLDVRRSPGSVRDNVRVQLYVPGSGYPSSHTAASSLQVDLAIVDADPAGLVDGFYSALTGGNPLTSVTVPAGSDLSPYVYLESPVAAGSYRVRMSSQGIAQTDSAVVTVSAPTLRFSRASAVVGKGMHVYTGEVTLQRVVDGTAVSSSEPVTVSFTSSDSSRAVIEQVTIPANQSSVNLKVRGVDFTGGESVQITASAPGHATSATPLAVTVVAPEYRFSSLQANRSPGSVRDDLRIQLYVVGAAYPSSQTAAVAMPIDLAIVDAAPAGIVSSFHTAANGGATVERVTVAAGSSISPYVYIESPRAAGVYSVRASSAGIATTTSAQVTVSPPALRFTRAQVIVAKGMRTYDSEVSVERVADGVSFSGLEPVVVQLRCSAATICSVPDTVTIPANASSAVVRVTGLGIGATTISASATGYDAATDAQVSVIAPQLSIGNMAGVRMAVGTSRSMSISLSTPGAGYSSSQVAVVPLTIDLTSSAPGVGTVPAAAVIATGARTVSNVPFVAVSPGTTTVTASGADMQSATTATVTVTP